MWQLGKWKVRWVVPGGLCLILLTLSGYSPTAKAGNKFDEKKACMSTILGQETVKMASKIEALEKNAPQSVISYDPYADRIHLPEKSKNDPYASYDLYKDFPIYAAYSDLELEFQYSTGSDKECMDILYRGSWVGKGTSSSDHRLDLASVLGAHFAGKCEHDIFKDGYAVCQSGPAREDRNFGHYVIPIKVITWGVVSGSGGSVLYLKTGDLEITSKAKKKEAAAAPPAPTAPKGVTDRLKELEALKSANLISEEEYQKKRASILEDL